MMRVKTAVAVTAIWMLVTSASSGVTIALNGVIGPSGTDASTVSGAGNPVNFTGFAIDSGPTTLTAAGSGPPAPVTFDFNAGGSFNDAQDRATGASPASGSQHVFADRKFDSVSISPIILDTNQNGLFTDETDDAPGDPNVFHFGFGMHADGFITFDLAQIRANNALPSNQAFTLAGDAGLANVPLDPGLTSAAIILDGAQLAVFDWDFSAGIDFNSYSLAIPGSARYLTFAGLSGLDNNFFADHIGFRNVELTDSEEEPGPAIQVPEPSSLALLGLGAIGLAINFRRKRLCGA